MTAADFLFIVFVLIVPFMAYRAHRLSGRSWLSPVLLAYGAGILWANVPTPYQSVALTENLSAGTILLALPLLLFGSDFRAFLAQARTVLLAFGLCVLSGIILTATMSVLFSDLIPRVWVYGAMLTGVYTGGTPNMNLVGFALEADPEAFIYLNATDIICGGIFLLFLLSLGSRVYGRFLPTRRAKERTSPATTTAIGKKLSLRAYLVSGLLAVLVAAASALLIWWLTGELTNIALLLLILTSLSVALSFHPRVRSLRAAYPTGEYLLLVFSVCIGALADFSNFRSEGLTILAFTAAVLYPAAALHVGLARVFRIDSDTTMITATAAFYGPPFVPQVASALRRPALIMPGVLCGLAGYGLGNYLGIGMGKWLQWLLG